MTIKRYDPESTSSNQWDFPLTPKMEESDCGDYVLYVDHIAEIKRNTRPLIDEISRLHGFPLTGSEMDLIVMRGMALEDAHERIEELEAERDAMLVKARNDALEEVAHCAEIFASEPLSESSHAANIRPMKSIKESI